MCIHTGSDMHSICCACIGETNYGCTRVTLEHYRADPLIFLQALLATSATRKHKKKKKKVCARSQLVHDQHDYL